MSDNTPARAASVTAPAALFVSLVTFGGLIGGRLFALLASGDRDKFLPIIAALYWIDGAGAIAAGVDLFLAC